MTQEEKQLLLKDLCARLPYGVKFQGEDSNVYTLDAANYFVLQVENVVFKPYLRPLSSMTEEEKTEFDKGYDTLLENLKNGMPGFNADAEVTAFHADFYNSHHLDYRGLIEKGLALEATEGMYKTE